jgi:hydrogenase-4 component F
MSKFFIIASGLGAGYTWLMILCLLLLTVVFAAFFRVIGSALFGEKPDSVVRGEANWLTLFSGAALILLIVILGLYIPPQLMTLLNGASGLVLTGNPDQQVAFMSMKDLVLSFAHLLP